MRIAWQGPFTRPLSLDKINREMSWSLLQRGHEMLLLLTGEPYPTQRARDPILLHYLKSYFTMPQPADIHVRHMWPPSFVARCGPLYLWQPWEYGSVPDNWIPQIRRYVEKVVVPSQAVKEMYLASGITEDRILILPLGVNPGIYNPWGPRATLRGARDTVLLFLGGLIPRKGFDLLLKAYAAAFRASDDVTLLVKIVGGRTVYPDQEGRRMLLEFQSRPNAPHLLVLEDDLDEASLATLYRSVDILVAPFRGEGFALPILEAVACGTFVVTSETSPATDYVPSVGSLMVPGQRIYHQVSYSKKPGWYFEPDLDALVAALRKAVNLPRVARRKAALDASKSILTHYTWTAVATAFETALGLPSSLPSESSTAPITPPLLSTASIPSDPRDTHSPPSTRASTTYESTPRPHASLVWVGPFRNASGYASEARDFLRQLLKLGITIRIVDTDLQATTAITEGEENYLSFLETLPVHPDAPLLYSGPPEYVTRRPYGQQIIRTMFETDRIPSHWVSKLNQMDLIIVPTEFNKTTFQQCGVAPERIQVVPGPVDTDTFSPAPLTERSTDPFLFLSIFDWQERKGWRELIRAWALAFTKHDPVRLVLKVTTFHSTIDKVSADIRDELSRLGTSLDACAPIILDTSLIRTPQDLARLYRQANVFVLPTRGEGWGRPILEAMSSGVPPLVPLWSAPACYLTPDCCVPLSFHLETVPDTFPIPWFRGHTWAVTEVDDLVDKLRWCLANQDKVFEIGLRARRLAEAFSAYQVTQELVKVLTPFLSLSLERI